MVLNPNIMYQWGSTWCSGRTLVYLCASSLKNLTVPQDLYSTLSVSLERSFLPCIQWFGTAGFKSRANASLFSLAAGSLFVLYCFYLSLLSFHRLVLWGWDSSPTISTSLALPISFNNNNNNKIKIYEGKLCRLAQANCFDSAAVTVVRYAILSPNLRYSFERLF